MMWQSVLVEAMAFAMALITVVLPALDSATSGGAGPVRAPS